MKSWAWPVLVDNEHNLSFLQYMFSYCSLFGITGEVWYAEFRKCCEPLQINISILCNFWVEFF